MREPDVLSEVPAGRGVRRLALGVALSSLAVFVLLAPFAKLPLGRLPAFIAFYQSALVVNDLVTAALLFAQWHAARRRSLYILGCGFLFTALMIMAHTLSFPGLFAPQGLIGGGAQSTAWIYMFWHALFPVFVVGYALAKPLPLSAGQAAAGIAGVFALAAALAALATAGERLLPEIMAGDGYGPAYPAVVGLVWLASVGALAALWRKQPRTVLDAWAMVVMCVWVCEIALAAVLNAGRYDLGFYAGRIYGLAASAFLLCVLIFEHSALYARLVANAGEREARLQAEAANRAKDQFLAILGHELRNPLAPIVNVLALMRVRDTGAFAHEREVLERQVTQLVRLVDDLLDASRLARGMVELRRARWEAVDIATRAAEMARPLLASRGQRLEIDVAPSGLALDADAERIVQALCNLLNNAAKFTPPGGRIQLGAAREGDEILFRVQDNGAGLTSELRPRLFEPFTQDADAISRAHGGLGLGLAIVKRLVTLHGGRVEARSEGPGRGAEFVVRLPAAPVHAGGAAAAPDSPVPPLPASPRLS